jgi:D-xylose transport system substrate-binding protein
VPNASGCLVGAAWDVYAEERISVWDEPAIKGRIEAAGDRYEMANANASPDAQAAQIDQFVADGAKVIIVRAQTDGVALVPPATQSAIDRAVDAGVAVIAYDRLIDSPKALMVAFDLVEAGRMESRAILAARPTGNYVIMRGTKGTLLDDQMASGIHEILQPAIDRGDIKIVAETNIWAWDASQAQTEMAEILTKNKNRVDAVIAEDDGMAGNDHDGVLEALKEVGLDGKVAIAGEGLYTWSLNEVALGNETVDVWQDLGLLGTTAGDAAVALCKNPDISKVKGITQFSSPDHNQIPALLVKPRAITKDNLNVALEEGWTTKADLCRDVDPAKAPPACR